MGGRRQRPQYAAVVDPLDIGEIAVPAEPVGALLALDLEDRIVAGLGEDVDQLGTALVDRFLERMDLERAEHRAQVDEEILVAVAILEDDHAVLDPVAAQRLAHRLVGEMLGAQAADDRPIGHAFLERFHGERHGLHVGH